ncbi:anti-sigma factor [Gordonia sp. CPCC 206044]|uniref:anti-sigma factor n=1 Tax=Gordonia sp. CPCC 206044 TaxID=3140793 RepID=UPI003AF35E1B
MTDDEILELAVPVGLDAVSDAELADVTAAVAEASPDVRAQFWREVRATREAMARVSDATAMRPPATLRARVLAVVRAEVTDAAQTQADRSDTVPVPIRSRRRRFVYLAAAAVVAIAVGALGWVIGASSNTDESGQQPTAAQVFAAQDVRTSSGAVAGGHATVTYSPSEDAGVLVMNDVPPPQPGTVYQMWLIGPSGSTSAGTMTDQDVAPSTTAVIPDLGQAAALGISVEPPGGSDQPTGPMVAELPLG